MSFEFSSEFDANNARSFAGLVKNNGLFKSFKQQQFILNLVDRWTDGDAELLKNMAFHRGIKLEEGQKLIDVSGYVRWADYGRKSIRRVEKSYVFDKFGIKAIFKLAFSYSKDGSSSAIVPEKTELYWSRPENIQLPDLTPEVSEKSNEWIGKIGDKKVPISGEVFRLFVASTAFGSVWFYHIEDAVGNTIVWKSSSDQNLKTGDSIMFEGTIKEHSEFRGRKQTTLIRGKRFL